MHSTYDNEARDSIWAPVCEEIEHEFAEESIPAGFHMLVLGQGRAHFDRRADFDRYIGPNQRWRAVSEVDVAGGKSTDEVFLDSLLEPLRDALVGFRRHDQ